MHEPDAVARAVAEVDLDAVAGNVERLREVSAPAAVMAVVKADGYGHGAVAAARAALAGGATWLGVALVEEALLLRRAGLAARLVAWLLAPGADLAAALTADVDLGVSTPWALAAAADAAARTGRPARLHLKADTGLGRNGATPREWPDLVEAARKAEADGHVAVVGLWSHLACADEPGHPSVPAQEAAFREAVEVAERAGLAPEVRHLANSAAALTRPAARYDLVRAGIAAYGLSPGPALGTPRDLGLRPAMTLRARLAHVKRVPAGWGVSYGLRWTPQRETTLGLVPLGYADGLPRAASGVGPLLVGARRRTIVGTVAMDQVVVDLGDDAAAAGDEVVLFGPGDRGEPTAQDWADATGTIGYEIVTRIGPRVPRRYVGRLAAGETGPPEASQ